MLFVANDYDSFCPFCSGKCFYNSKVVSYNICPRRNFILVYYGLKSISDTSKSLSNILVNKSCVIKEILKYYTDGRLSFPHSLYLPRVVFKRGLFWMVYRYCQFTFQTCADCKINHQPLEIGG